MAQDIRWKQRYDNFERALRQVELAAELQAQRPLTDLEMQGMVQSFEFTHELAWNVLKDYLAYEGITGLVGSRSTVREAFKQELIADGALWIDMIDKRNLSSHTYDLALARKLVEAISGPYLTAFRELRERLKGERQS